MRNKVCKRRPRRRFRSLQTQHNVPPAPSLLELQRERRETTELGYPGRCPRQPPETQGPGSGRPVTKSLLYGTGTRVFVGRPDFVTAPVKYLFPRFHTPVRRAPGPRQVFLFFYRSALLPIRTRVSNFEAWVLRLGTWIGRDSRGTQDSGSKEM